MKATISAILLAGMLTLGTAAALAQANDLNRVARAVTSDIDPASIIGQSVDPPFVGEVCGTASIPGPKNGTSITLTIHNSVADQITNVTIDPFGAFGKRGFVIQSTFGLVPPPGGTLTDLYPDGPADGRGPVVLAATGWDGGENASLSMDPDTYNDPSFGAVVSQMTGTVIETAYVATGRRCSGRLAFNATLNASIATLKQKSPVP
jgi:hypothetical protein